MKSRGKGLSVLLAVAATILGQPAWGDVPHNSRHFSISNYFYPDIDGNYVRYRAHGFAQQRTDQNVGRLFLLPVIELVPEKVQFINETGIDFDPLTSDTVATTIIVPLRITKRLPSKPHLPAIAAALEGGIERSHYVMPMAKATDGSFLIFPPASGLMHQLMNSVAAYQTMLDEQERDIGKYENYAAELVSLSEMEVNVILDNQIIARRVFDNTFISRSGSFLNIEVVNPSLYQQNRIARGNMNVLVSYKFRDARTRTINARFDARRIIHSFLSETQRSAVSSSSSGWSFLGLGSRRKTVKSAFDSEVRSRYEGSNYESTSIEMFDASEDMIAEFERDFFPELSRDKVIENHLAAAAEAGSDTRMRDLHLKYAESLQISDPNLEVDIAGAVASLAAKDYAGFLAKGVRWGSHRATGNSSFRRVVVDDAEIESKREWAQMRTVSVQHALTENVVAFEKDEHRPSLGLCGAMQYNYPVPERNMWGQMMMRQRQGMMPSCVTEGGPAFRAGLIPGMIVTAIGGRAITNDTQLADLLRQYEPGDRIRVKIREYDGMNPMNTWERDFELVLTAGAPK